MEGRKPTAGSRCWAQGSPRAHSCPPARKEPGRSEEGRGPKASAAHTAGPEAVALQGAPARALPPTATSLTSTKRGRSSSACCRAMELASFLFTQPMMF